MPQRVCSQAHQMELDVLAAELQQFQELRSPVELLSDVES